MKQDILAHTGFCRRCKAPAGEKCEDFEMRGNKRREIYYCIRDCFDSDCNVFWSKGRLYKGFEEVGRCSLKSAVSNFQSLWEYDNGKFYQWYRGRWQKTTHLTWWSIYPCPFPIKKRVFMSNLETRGVEYFDLGAPPKQLTFLSQRSLMNHHD